MSSGLPINTKAEANEYRKRYLAYLGLEEQNNNFNLQANQVYRETGQPSRPPDMRTTTEKLADVEKLRVELLQEFLKITDGIQAERALDRLDNNLASFALQKIPLILTDIKARFSRGIPADSLVAYIRALYDKEQRTNGVSFPAQQATAEEILRAIQNGQIFNGANPGPFAPAPAQPAQPAPAPANNQAPPIQLPVPGPAPAPAPRPVPAPRPGNPLAEAIQQRAREIGFAPESVEARAAEEQQQQAAQRVIPVARAVPDFDSLEELQNASRDAIVEWFDFWAQEIPDLANLVDRDYRFVRNERRLKKGIPVATMRQAVQQAIELYIQLKVAEDPRIVGQLRGRGIGNRTRRQLFGRGLARMVKKIDTSMPGVVAVPSYVKFGKNLINQHKLQHRIVDLRSILGHGIKNYNSVKVSHGVSKILRDMIRGRGISMDDYCDLDVEDQAFIHKLASKSKILDTLNLPTPKITKDEEEKNKFEILKGQIIAGNDSRELIKEFKSMLVKMSNDDRISKKEAREVLLDLAAMGY